MSIRGHKCARLFSSQLAKKSSAAQTKLMQMEHDYGVGNYKPIEVVLERGEGAVVWDVDGNSYIDCLAAYSAVNQGHCHPHIVNALKKQADKLTLTSRAFYNNELPGSLQYITDLLGYDRAIYMNSGVEAVETALKFCRKWGYEVKGVPANEAKMLFCHNNFMGRTLGTISCSNDDNATKNFGPFLPGMQSIPFNDLPALKKALEADPTICGFMIEPIQGEAGVIIPDDGYLAGVRRITKEHGVCFIADEVQTGLCRTGKMLAVDHEDVKPDMLTLGKALSGGIMPVSCILASDEIMGCIQPGQHGSTFGGNPLAMAVARASLEVLVQEQLADRSRDMGQLFLSELNKIKSPTLRATRGRGLMMAIDIAPRESGYDASDLCYLMRDRGVLAKYTHKDTIRFAPPLVISEQQVLDAVGAIAGSIEEFDKH